MWASGLGRIGSTPSQLLSVVCMWGLWPWPNWIHTCAKARILFCDADPSASRPPCFPAADVNSPRSPSQDSVHSNDVPRFVDGGWFIPGTLERVSQKSLVVPNVPLIGSDIGSQLAHQKLYNTCVISSSRKTSSYRERITTPRTKNNMYQRQSTNKMHIVHLRWSRHANQRTTKIRLQQLWCVLGATSLQPNVG
jgi:hypothetical protein